MIVSQENLSAHLRGHPLWRLTEGGKSIYREFQFKDFSEAFSFMTEIGFHAEKLNHHPDWRNVYNKVFIVLITHDCDGISERDLILSHIIDQIYTSRFHSLDSVGSD